MNSQIKKKVCNPPAQRVAGSGDPELLGWFEAAGAVLDDVPAAMLDKWVAEVTEIEESYMDQRKALADKCSVAMKALVMQVVSPPSVTTKRA